VNIFHVLAQLVNRLEMGAALLAVGFYSVSHVYISFG
jgi:hypothetical protein